MDDFYGAIEIMISMFVIWCFILLLFEGIFAT